MNWLMRYATPYLDTQLFPNSLNNWNAIEHKRSLQRDAAHKLAEEIALAKGHELDPWSAINSTHCRKCSREININNIYSRTQPKFQGRALVDKCDDSYNSSNDLWDYRMNAYME